MQRRFWLAPLASVSVYGCILWSWIDFAFGRGAALVLVCAAFVFVGFGIYEVVVGARKRRPSVALAGVLTLTLPVVYLADGVQSIAWIGKTTRMLAVEVVDDRNGRLIVGATVRVFIPEYTGDGAMGLTAADGIARIEYEFTATGDKRLFRSTGNIYLWQQTLEVNAAGYETVSESLEAYTGPFSKLYGPPIPQVKVRLRKKP